MKRILHIIDSMGMGGAQNFIMNVYRNINRDNTQFDFLVHSPAKSYFESEIESLGGKIYRIPTRREGILKNRKALNAFFKTHPYEVVHMHESSLTYITPLEFAYKYHVKERIIHSHSTRASGSRIHRYLHLFNRLRIEKYATRYCACSDSAASFFYKGLNAMHDACCINNAIDTEKYIFDDKLRQSVREELSISPQTVVMGHVGRFDYPKNHKYLLDIFHAYNQDNSDSVLILIGDGILRNEIEEYAVNLGLKDKIHFLGVRSDITSYLNAFDVFVMPSLYEGFPVTLVEAEAAGLPCFVSETITKEVRLNDNVYFIPINADPFVWVDKINAHLVSGDRLSYGENIRRSQYDITYTIRQLERIYNEKLL